MKLSPVMFIVARAVLDIKTYRLKLEDLADDVQIGNFTHQAISRILATDPRYTTVNGFTVNPVEFLQWMREANSALVMLTYLVDARDCGELDQRIGAVERRLAQGGAS